MKSKIFCSILLLGILVCGCQCHSDENDHKEIGQIYDERELCHDDMSQVQYELRFENLVESEPRQMTYPPTPRDIHCQLIKMADDDDKFDMEFYDSIYLARAEDTLHRYYYYDMLPVSMLIANKRHYPKAYYDTYTILAELFGLNSWETVSDDVVDLCMFYLIKSAQLGYRPACLLTGIYYEDTVYDHKKLFEKIHNK